MKCPIWLRRRSLSGCFFLVRYPGLPRLREQDLERRRPHGLPPEVTEPRRPQEEIGLVGPVVEEPPVGVERRARHRCHLLACPRGGKTRRPPQEAQDRQGNAAGGKVRLHPQGGPGKDGANPQARASLSRGTPLSPGAPGRHRSCARQATPVSLMHPNSPETRGRRDGTGEEGEIPSHLDSRSTDACLEGANSPTRSVRREARAPRDVEERLATAIFPELRGLSCDALTCTPT